MKKALTIVICLVMLCLCSGCDSSTYQQATELYEQKKYTEAKKLFEKIPEYEDSKEKIKNCDYMQGSLLFEDEKFEDAKKLFDSIPDYKDAKTQSKKCSDAIYYEKGLESYNNGEYSEAKDFFGSIGTEHYKDTQRLLDNCEKGITYNTAVKDFEKGDFDSAKKSFSKVSGFKDAAKYLEAIKELQPYQATWDNKSKYKSIDINTIELKGLNSDYILSGTLMCSIGAPYKLKIDSSYKTGWCANARVIIHADYNYFTRPYNGYQSNTADISFDGSFWIMESEVTGKDTLAALCVYDNTDEDTLFIPGYYSSKKINLYFSTDLSTLDILEQYDSYEGTRTTLKKK